MSSHVQLSRRTDEAFHVFNTLADQVIRSFSPRNILIVGPVVGLLAEALWDRGVPAYLEYFEDSTLEDVRLDVRAFCLRDIGSAPSLDYDLVIAVCVGTWEEHSLSVTYEYLKRRSKTVLFVDLEGVQEVDHAESPLLAWVETLQSAGLVPETAFDMQSALIRVLLTRYSGEPLTAAHLVDFVKMRRLSSSLGRTLERAEKAETEARRKSDELSHAISRIERLQVEALQVQSRLEDAINNVNLARMLQAQGSMSPQARDEFRRSQEMVQRLSNDLQAVYSSTCWRLTAPIRVIGRQAPSLTRAFRMVAKLAYWTITLQLPQRLQARREFRRTHGLK
ncbi:hypothetical protein PCAR4_760010 [Paraburkholderia caribensis]|nr:hypothetical protein PCAR4_760010 [Paraburkholderia caribensis]